MEHQVRFYPACNNIEMCAHALSLLTQAAQREGVKLIRVVQEKHADLVIFDDLTEVRAYGDQSHTMRALFDPYGSIQPSLNVDNFIILRYRWLEEGFRFLLRETLKEKRRASSVG